MLSEGVKRAIVHFPYWKTGRGPTVAFSLVFDVSCFWNEIVLLDFWHFVLSWSLWHFLACRRADVEDLYTESGQLYTARSRLDRIKILQVNTNAHAKTLAEIYTIHSFAELESNLKTMKSASGKRQLSNLMFFSNIFQQVLLKVC